MAINIVLGGNGTGKTEFLKEKIKEYTENNEKVVSNFNRDITTVTIDKNKVKRLIESYYTSDFGTYDELSEIKQYDYKYYMSLIVAEGDILVLDEPYMYLNGDQMVDMYYTLNEIRNMWKDIYISGHYEDGFYTFEDYNDTYVLKFTGYGNHIKYSGKYLKDVMLSV